jgi:tetratricopeptide (TPR) repeat protein
MWQQALQGYEKALGPDHTSTLNSLYCLAIVRKNQGKLDEAEKICQRALQGCEKALGPDHTSTLNFLYYLTIIRQDQAKLGETKKIYQRALKSYEKTCDLEHTSARNALSGLYEIYRRRCVSLQEQKARHQANLAKLNPDKQTKNTIFAVANLCEKFGVVQPSFFSILGRMLIWAGQEDDAVFAFQHQFRLAESKPQQGRTVCCCGKRLHAGMERFVCRACVDIDLCDECYKNYEMDGFISRESAANCQAHSFLAVPGEEKGNLGSGSSSPDVSLTQWLTTIRAQHQMASREV